MKYYATEKINDQLTLIRSLSGELLYLAEGTDRAVLIDTCVGVGHLKAFVDSLTDKPLTVLLTHGHVDHAPGAPEFDTVYMNERDIPLYRTRCPLAERKGYLKANLGSRFAELAEDEFVPETPDYPFLPLHDGDSFDLGGLHVDAYALPGHTPGSMVFLLRELRTLITGDSCNNATYLFLNESSPLAEYRDNLKGVQNRLAGQYDRIYMSHVVMEAGTDMIDNVLEAIDEVLRGEADDLPYEFRGYHACIAKKCNMRFEREDGKSGNIVYDKEKLV